MLMSEYNNPVMYVDPSGESFLAILGTLAIAAAVGAIVGGALALINGEDIIAGVAGGAITSVLTTIGLSIALATGGSAGILISAGFGFVGGFSGDIVNQGISYGWDNIDRFHAAKVGVLNGTFAVLSFGTLNYIYRSSPSYFNGITSKSLPYLTRLGNALSISAPAYYLTITYGSIYSYFSTQIGMFIDKDITSENQIVIDAYAGCD